MNGNRDCYTVKKETVDWIVIITSSMIPQPLIAYFVMNLLDEGWATFWYIILAINVFQLVMWSAKALVSSVVFRLYLKKRLIETVYNDLVEFKFPTEDLYLYLGEYDCDIYYHDISINDLVPCNIRMKSIIYLNELKSPQTGFLQFMRLQKVHKEAIDKYYKRHPGITFVSYYDKEQPYTEPIVSSD